MELDELTIDERKRLDALVSDCEDFRTGRTQQIVFWYLLNERHKLGETNGRLVYMHAMESPTIDPAYLARIVFIPF